MTENWSTTAIAISALILQTIALIVAGVRALGQTEEKLRSEINNNKMASYTEITQAIRNVGETFTAMRQKITEVELYMRDNFLPKDAFAPVISDLATDIKDSAGRIEARLLRMENKIDANHRQPKE